MEWEIWKNNWRKVLECVNRLGGEVSDDIYIDRPATEDEILAVEKELGVRLPESFRETMLNFSKKVEFNWNLPDTIDLPHELREIFGCDFNWSLKDIYDIESTRKSWVDECFPDENDDYDKVWHNKLGFMNVANGDVIAFDMKDYPGSVPVVYLSHDDGDCHGYKLGDDFNDFISRWSSLGCPGPEDWQLYPFIKDSVSGIDPKCKNAECWKEILGLDN